MNYKISYDVSQFLDASIEQVMHTLRDAFILVALVVFLFLGDWRSTQTLPRGYDIAWENLSYDEAKRGNEAIYIFTVVLIFVYLVLAAQYESFVLPLAVILSLPPGIFSSFLLLKAMELANDVYA